MKIKKKVKKGRKLKKKAGKQNTAIKKKKGLQIKKENTDKKKPVHLKHTLLSLCLALVRSLFSSSVISLFAPPRRFGPGVNKVSLSLLEILICLFEIWDSFFFFAFSLFTSFFLFIFIFFFFVLLLSSTNLLDF